MSTAREVILLDGGMGHELARIGAPFRQPEWSALALMEAPQSVRSVHDHFIAAGAQVITTNSYAVVPFHVGEAVFAVEGRQLAALAGQLARDAATAASHPVRVAGSLPPTCGSYRADLFDRKQADRILACLIGGLAPFVDVWLAETQSTTAEIVAVRAALNAQRQTQPLWVSYTLQDEQPDPAHPRIRSGEAVAEAVRVAVELGAAAVLFNCSQPEVMSAAVKAAQTMLANLQASVPLGVYANAFPPQSVDAEANGALDELRPDLDPPGYARWAQRWLDEGVSIVGGCCGIGPDHIACVHDVIERHR
ncbi:S-methylmethionine-dependent homocysteine/selenocysteine methylase [Silvimonas terrae]|uniref:S-methylmethionine-dependent homocysteine/selenocysteine methylase n=1 Tax=Silvimonas terrae TaxID=300266 RepID=A0A840RG04_9NEIS|nr:homocysteine S-methyltransferase family protein [Silvimonas terrae]MBB5191222.1 S-methylmethionine-dependent homocysteine/selenocysteine methylase [Silvimonas terrae]